MLYNYFIENLINNEYYYYGDKMNCSVFSRILSAKNKKVCIMGILNVTPDSFSDGGKFNCITKALSHAERMAEDGADMIDIGAVSTRPFAPSVSEAEEWERIKEVLKEIKKSCNVPVSIDTVNPYTAEKCLDMGADIINDVSGVFNPRMADVIKKYNCGWVIMHGGVHVRKTEEYTEFADGIINDVNSFFCCMLDEISACGISLSNICLDPGFGFSKNSQQNTELLDNLEKIDKHDLPMLCALSRKRFIGELSGESEPEKRDAATLSANLKAISKGADIIRVHNVALHKEYI